MNYILHPLQTLALVIDLLAALWITSRSRRMPAGQTTSTLTLRQLGGRKTKITIERIR